MDVFADGVKFNLRGRKYRVRIENEHIDKISITTGIAQGSFLGPLHYLAYENDMGNIIKYSSIYRYADDTFLVIANESLTKVEKMLQLDFTNQCMWSYNAGLV